VVAAVVKTLDRESIAGSDASVPHAMGASPDIRGRNSRENRTCGRIKVLGFAFGAVLLVSAVASASAFAIYDSEVEVTTLKGEQKTVKRLHSQRGRS
jgi:hypothetical protein